MDPRETNQVPWKLGGGGGYRALMKEQGRKTSQRREARKKQKVLIREGRKSLLGKRKA